MDEYKFMKKKVSVLVVTRNRKEMLKRCLDSLVVQSVAPFEVIVVDNGSGDGTKELIQSFAHHLPIKYFFENRPSIPFARNRAFAEATGEFTLFIDDDCQADHRLIEEVLNAHTLYPEAIAIQGKIAGRAQTNSGRALQLNYETFFNTCFFIDRQQQRLRYLWASNVSFSLPGIYSINGWFNESIPVSEDRELGLRLTNNGCAIVYCPKMMVTHDYDGRPFLELLRGAFRHAFSKGGFKPREEGFGTLIYLVGNLIKRACEDKSSGFSSKASVIFLNLFMYGASSIGVLCGLFKAFLIKPDIE